METTATSGIKFKDKLGYALGDMGGTLTFGLVGSFLQMFYSDVLQIPLGQIAVLMVVARIWDAVNDPIWGSIVDRRKIGRNGKFRPYILWLSVPVAASALLMFLKIPGLTQSQYLLYIYITYIAYGMLYTGYNIPYGSMASVITDDPNERSDLSVFRSVGAGVGGLPAQIVLPLFVFTQTAAGVKYLDGNKLFAAVAVMMAVSVLVCVISFKMTRERVASPPLAKNDSVLQTIRVLLKNRPFIVLCLTAMLLIASQLYTQTTFNYLFKDYFQRPELYSLVTIVTYAPMAALLPVLGKLVRRFGKKNICAAGALLSFGANLLLWLIRTQNPYVFMAFCFFSGLGLTFFTMEVWAMATDVIDYQELLSGKRAEGTSYAFFNFARKLGHTAAGSAGALMLGVIGYDVKNTLTAQPQRVINGMYTVATLVPAVAYLLMFLLLGLLYPLGKEKVEETQRQLAEQRAQRKSREENAYES